jgi:TolB-like protein/tetratricopeptide (TPR) repeat protein
MSGTVESAPSEKPSAPPPSSFWARIKQHKVLQWSLAYLGASLALAHAQELLAHTYHWPEVVGQLLMGMLIVGFPLVIALAWYHGHKGLKRVGQGELMLISILLLIGAGLLWTLTRTPVEPISRMVPAPATAASQSANVAPAPDRTAIAVLPFANLTGDASKDYLGDGMAEEVIHSLAKVPGFKVPARTSSFAYKGRNVDIRQIARDLGVGAILEGSVRSAGESIRITVELINAQDGLHIWSDSYNRQFTDIFKLQDELSTAIVQALRGTVDPSAAPVAARGPGTQDVEAYRLYLQARAAYIPTQEGVHRAMDLYDQALARDPRFAQALAWRADTRSGALRLGFPYPGALEKSEEDARRALALDASLPEAHLALGDVAALRGRWVEAEMNCRTAANAQPPDARILAFYAVNLLLTTGRLREAHTLVSEAYRLAPADAVIVRDNAIVDTSLGLDSSAIRFADLAVELGMPSNAQFMQSVYISAAVRSGHYEEAGARFAAWMPAALREAGGTDAFKLAYIAMGDQQKVPAAVAALHRLVQDAWSGIDGPARRFLVTLLTRLGAVDQAYDVANRALDEFVRDDWYGGPWTVLWLPDMRAFRKDPRFQAFATRLKLIDYWKQYGPPDECDWRGEALTCR